MKKHPIQSDSRYTITKEFCGQQEARFVLRWCGEFIDQSPFYSSMLTRAVGHKAVRNGSPVIAGVEA
jgi:hypothetical protein